jgi:hypothetical protein
MQSCIGATPGESKRMEVLLCRSKWKERRIGLRRFRQNGTRVTIVEKTTYIEAPTFEGIEWVEGLKRYETARGEFLNVTGPGTFESPLTGVSYQRVYPLP